MPPPSWTPINFRMRTPTSPKGVSPNVTGAVAASIAASTTSSHSRDSRGASGYSRCASPVARRIGLPTASSITSRPPITVTWATALVTAV